jgi:hypothetical protein
MDSSEPIHQKMSKYFHFTKLKHLIFPYGGSTAGGLKRICLPIDQKLLVYVEMILKFMFKNKVPSTSRVETVVPRWNPPPAGWICVNVDAALFPAERRMGWAAVFRDHCGAFILSCSEGLTGFPTPEMAEALAIRRALSVSKEHGFQKIILVSDCLSLI